MRKIIVLSVITLDGVMQATGGPQEDTSGGFKYGGWAAPYMTAEGRAIVKKQMAPADYLLGRKTFKLWEPFLPHADYWPAINEGTKYVLSKKVKKSDWKNTVFIKSVADIKKIKRTEGLDLQVWGSSELVQLLLKNDLVDEFWLRICPLILGKGKKLFAGGAVPAALELTYSFISPTGVIFANYKRVGKVKTATIGA